jgi:hypothetical protein
MSILYKVCWKNLVTGETGCGKAYYPYDIAQSWVEYANKTYPDIQHYLS